MKNIMTSLILVSIFKNVVNDSLVSTYIELINAVETSCDIKEVLYIYSDFINQLYEKEDNQNLFNYVKNLIYTDENILSRGCSDCIKDNNNLLDTARYELALLDKLFDYDYSKIKTALASKYPEYNETIEHLPSFFIANKDNFDLDDILLSYKKNGYGDFACYCAFKFNENKEILPIKYFDTLTFNDLKNYEYQKSVIAKNTQAFLDGKDANNILLYGDRGCGKSSTVKALINEFQDYNLKIIQISKESFIYLSDLYEQIRNLPLKFIIFADDISFEEDDKNFSSIKAVLEGSLSNKPSNTIIYATTNRMHLVKESFSSREGNEIHYNDTIDEMVSLSDRFGIMLTFSLLTKKEYLEIVEKIANDCCVPINDVLFKKAEEFAALKSIRTPRVARQFITDYIASL